MENAATPETAPAGGSDNIAAQTDEIVSILGGNSEGSGASGKDAGGDSPAGERSEGTEPQTEKAEAQSATYRVKIRGKDYDVTLDELQKGYSRTEDYKAKTAELAEKGRALEPQRQALADRVQRLDSLIQHLESFDPVLADARRTDWVKLAHEDPHAYLTKQAEVQQRGNALQAAYGERQAFMAQHLQQIKATEMQKLIEAIPDFADATKSAEMAKAMTEYLTDQGFSQQELAGVYDHRIFKIVKDALAYRQGEADRKAIQGKKAPPPKANAIRPDAKMDEAKGGERAKRLWARADRTGRMDDQAAAILATIRS